MFGAIPALAGWMNWDPKRQGIDANGVPESLNDPEVCSDSPPNSVQWNFIPGQGNTTVDPINITLSGAMSGTYDYNTHTGGVYKFIIPYASQNLSEVSAVVNFGGDLGRNPVLTVSHGCTGDNEIPEFPTIALPIAALIGLVFFFQYKKRKIE